MTTEERDAVLLPLSGALRIERTIMLAEKTNGLGRG